MRSVAGHRDGLACGRDIPPAVADSLPVGRGVGRRHGSFDRVGLDRARRRAPVMVEFSLSTGAVDLLGGGGLSPRPYSCRGQRSRPSSSRSGLGNFRSVGDLRRLGLLRPPRLPAPSSLSSHRHRRFACAVRARSAAERVDARRAQAARALISGGAMKPNPIPPPPIRMPTWAEAAAGNSASAATMIVRRFSDILAPWIVPATAPIHPVRCHTLDATGAGRHHALCSIRRAVGNQFENRVTKVSKKVGPDLGG